MNLSNTSNLKTIGQVFLESKNQNNTNKKRLRIKYRSRVEIIRDIIEAIKAGSKLKKDYTDFEGASKTNIMYKAYLAHSQSKDYLTLMIKSKLITYNQENRLYNVTSKGLDYLKKIQELDEMVIDTPFLLMANTKNINPYNV